MTVKKERTLRAKRYRKDFGLSWADSWKAAKDRKPLLYDHTLTFIKSYYDIRDGIEYDTYLTTTGKEVTFVGFSEW